MPVALLEATIKHSTAPQDFLKHILNKLRDDIVGTLCKQDQIIVKLGIIFYEESKERKIKRFKKVCKYFTFMMVFQSHLKHLHFKELHSNDSACTCSHLIFFHLKSTFLSV